MAVLKSNEWLVAAEFVVLLSFVFAEQERFSIERSRVQRAVCSGPASKVNQRCRWSELECPCVNGAYCNISSHNCEVCQVTTTVCTSPCRYPCRNGGTCTWETGTCQCLPEFWGVDCSSRREVPAVVTPRVTATIHQPAPDPYPSPSWPRPGTERCPDRPCLNGGWCDAGTCVCPRGYYLLDCSLCMPREQPHKCLDHCGLECKRGDCLTEIKKCHCSVDYTGEDCSLCIPAVAYMNCTNLCSPMCINGATCNSATRKCECTPGWTGESCGRPCPQGTFGLNCLELCQCPVGPCDPVTGHCLCGPDSQNSPHCTSPCDCLVDGVCFSQADCPTGNEQPPSVQTFLPTTAAGSLQEHNQLPADQAKSMMTLVIATAAGAAGLLIVVVILIVCLVRTRQKNTRKLGRNQEAEGVPMTDKATGNTYDDASSMPMLSAQQSATSYRPTSGYEDVSELHKDMPNLPREHVEPSDISPYAATGNVTVHAENVPSEYSYVTVNELNVLKEKGTGKGEESYDRLDFLPRERSVRRPVVTDGMYGSLQDDGSYEDASSCSFMGPPVGNHQDAISTSSGYAKMSPLLNNRKASSLKSPRRELLSEVQRKSSSLKLPSTDVQPSNQPYENAYVGFDPKRSSQDCSEYPGMPVPPPPESVSNQPKSKRDKLSGKNPKGEIPQYAKPMKRKSQQADQQEVPHYAKPNKQKSQVPQYAKPNKPTSSKGYQNGSPAQPNIQLERPPEGSLGKPSPGSKVAAGYAHLMHAESPSLNNSK
ncbi:multiple epidermal growth factor-like domains protein 10 [Acanthaster planci]|uniref:Multiple epidermal growth factor-like domains protein 10 n=1 Tax=Acanthaster planci TaxID=133434 RepID=A0A8B7XNW1_ACAPL|nr:multiple epidermal growth factor-like domains protein 10 [Acanthaster planci]